MAVLNRPLLIRDGCRISPAKKMNRLLAALLPILASGCQTLGLDDGVEIEIENEWRAGAVGVVHRYHPGGCWSHDSISKGEGVFVRLYESHHLKGSFDGTSYHEITFQLPSDVREGAQYELRSVPPDRRGIPDTGGSGESAEMKSGEMTALQFGNPAWGLLGKEVESKVTVISIGKREVTIHLRLKAVLHPNFSFDIDRNFSLDVVKPS